MTVFKLMNMDWADKLVSGESVRIGTISQYRKMEQGIGDDHEGVQIAHIDHFDSNDSPSFESNNKAIFFKQSMPFARHAKNAEVKNSTFSRAMRSYHIFCTSQTIDADVISTLEEDSKRASGTAYNCVVPIINVDHFGQAVADRLYNTSHTIKATRSPTYVAHPVSYTGHQVDFTKQITGPSPFAKRPIFRKQKEFRFWFDVANMEDYVDLAVEFPDGTFGDPFPIAYYERHIGKYIDP